MPIPAKTKKGRVDLRGTSLRNRAEKMAANKGCVPCKKMEFAMVVICSDAIHVMKCPARKKPATEYCHRNVRNGKAERPLL